MRFRKPTLYKKRKTRNKRIKTRRKMRRYMGGGLNSLQIEHIENSIKKVKEEIKNYNDHISHYILLEQLRKTLDAMINPNTFFSKAKKLTNSLLGRPPRAIEDIQARIKGIETQIRDNNNSVLSIDNLNSLLDELDGLISLMSSSMAPEENYTIQENELNKQILDTKRDVKEIKIMLKIYKEREEAYKLDNWDPLSREHD